MAYTLLVEMIIFIIPCYISGTSGKKGVIMASEDMSMQDSLNCNRAAEVISHLIRNECQGFILPPSEVRRMLGIPGYCRTWYLHRNIVALRKKLANSFICMSVHPEQGICFTVYKAPRQSTVRVSPVQ
jgi:hypothetical protein